MNVQTKSDAPVQPLVLTPKQRAELMAMAHALRPVVHIGGAGVNEGVQNEIRLALRVHELIKVKLPKATDAATKSSQENLIQTVLPQNCAIVGRIGGTVVLFCRVPNDPKIALSSARASRPQLN